MRLLDSMRIFFMEPFTNRKSGMTFKRAFKCIINEKFQVIVTVLIDQDPKAPRPYLFSDAQNVYDRVVLVCTVSICILASLGGRPILRYEVQQVSKNLTNFTYILITHFYICYT